jgi:hypothetical protein
MISHICLLISKEKLDLLLVFLIFLSLGVTQLNGFVA